MEIGTVVKSKAGRDKDSFLVVMKLDGKTVWLCDGKKRPIENLKQKKILHVSVTKAVLPQESLLTNNKIKKALKDFEEQ